MPLAPVVIPAAISGVSTLLGAKKGADSSKKAVQAQQSAADAALAEQRRIFDLQYAQEQKDRASRQQTFAQYGNTQKPLSGNLPNPYGMSDAQTSAFRNAFGQASSGQGQPQGMPAQPPAPPMPPAGGGSGAPPREPRNAMASTVWMQAPTGEVMEVDLAQAPMLMQRGAKIIPGPTGQMGR